MNFSLEVKQISDNEWEKRFSIEPTLTGNALDDGNTMRLIATILRGHVADLERAANKLQK